jgi:hypothetical protein
LVASCTQNGSNGQNVLVVRGTNVGLATSVKLEGLPDSAVKVWRHISGERAFEACTGANCMAVLVTLPEKFPTNKTAKLVLATAGNTLSASTMLKPVPGEPWVARDNYQACVKPASKSTTGNSTQRVPTSTVTQSPANPPPTATSGSATAATGCSGSNYQTVAMPFTLSVDTVVSFYTQFDHGGCPNAPMQGTWMVHSLDGQGDIAVTFDASPEGGNSVFSKHKLAAGRWAVDAETGPEGFIVVVSW